LPEIISIMPDNKDKELDKEPLKRKIKELIKKKSNENSELKKLLEGLNKPDSSLKKDN